MNIVTADIDWIPLLIFLITSIVSVIKYSAKRTQSVEPQYTPIQEEEEETTFAFESQQTANFHNKEKLVAHTTIKEEDPKEKSSTSQFQQEKPDSEDQSTPKFDLRKAVIGNIILNRPKF